MRSGGRFGGPAAAPHQADGNHAEQQLQRIGGRVRVVEGPERAARFRQRRLGREIDHPAQPHRFGHYVNRQAQRNRQHDRGQRPHRPTAIREASDRQDRNAERQLDPPPAREEEPVDLGRLVAERRAEVFRRETADRLGRDQTLAVAAGDLLAVFSAGAYAAAMGSAYNSRPAAAEVLVEGGRVELVRERGRAEDLYAGERLRPETA